MAEWGGRDATERPLFVGHCSKHTPQLFDAYQVVDGDELVDIGHCSNHTLGKRLVAWIAQQWIEPDEAVARALQSGHFLGKERRITTVPPVADDQNYRSTGHDTA